MDPVTLKLAYLEGKAPDGMIAYLVHPEFDPDSGPLSAIRFNVGPMLLSTLMATGFVGWDGRHMHTLANPDESGARQSRHQFSDDPWNYKVEVDVLNRDGKSMATLTECEFNAPAFENDLSQVDVELDTKLISIVSHNVPKMFLQRLSMLVGEDEELSLLIGIGYSSVSAKAKALVDFVEDRVVLYILSGTWPNT